MTTESKNFINDELPIAFDHYTEAVGNHYVSNYLFGLSIACFIVGGAHRLLRNKYSKKCLSIIGK